VRWVDRLGRNYGDVCDTIREFMKHGVIMRTDIHGMVFDRAAKEPMYVQAFLEQVLMSAACNGRHSLKERLARWLLMMRDHSDADVMPITQDLLAELPGVQRSSPTRAAAELEEAGLILPGRRHFTILDRQGLIKARRLKARQDEAAGVIV
jgi:hypothetical protein